MKVGENRRPSIDDASAVEPLQLQEAAKIASIYHKGDPAFSRNINLSHIVHATLNFTQFLTALITKIFHHVHHLIHHHRQSKDQTIPDLPEERNSIFSIYPICMFISLILGILWLFTNFSVRYPIIAPVGCIIGGVLMLLGGIYAMKHAEKHINLNEVSDEELINHPIFIHNFILCIISIFGMVLYLIQFWILFDHWRLLADQVNTKSIDYENSKSSSISESNSTGSEITNKSEERSELQEVEGVGRPYPIPALEALPSHSEVVTQNPENDPVILYCCFVDCYNYVKNQCYTPKPTHEFQVIHVL